MQHILVLRQSASSSVSSITHMCRGTPERVAETDMEEKKVVILVLFEHKKSSCSYIKLRLKH